MNGPEEHVYMHTFNQIGLGTVSKQNQYLTKKNKWSKSKSET